MLFFIAGCLLAIIGMVLTIALVRANKKNDNDSTTPIGGLAVLAIGLVLILLSSIYTQDVGETVVLRNLGGSVAGHSEDAGFHFKAPWQDTIKYDTRNNLINMYGDTEYSYDGGSAQGSKVTINDASGAKANIDIQVNYSLDPSTAEYLYSEYGTQTVFTQNCVSQDVRSVAREQAGKFDTITLLTDRAQYTKAITDALTAKWDKIGLTVEQVTVQDISYPKSITDAYARSQEAEVEKQTALNNKEVAQVEAETKVVEAEGEKKANEILSQSLTTEVLQQQYINALDKAAHNGSLIVVPSDSMPIVNTK